MEINGRFWGSLPLAIAAKADFPAMLLEMEIEGEIAPRPRYRDNVYCRLLSRDLYWYEAILRSDTDTRIVDIPSPSKVLRELALFLHPRHRYDVQSLIDPLPGLVDMGCILMTYFGRVRTLFEERRFRARQRNAWRCGEVAVAISGARSVLFLCYGNINRSALAHGLMRSCAEDSGISVASAGFHEEVGRPVDPVMVEVAAQFDLDLGELRSSCVSHEQLRESDVIFVMEKSHYDRLVKIDPSLNGKVFLLGAHHSGAVHPVEIEDPYGRDKNAYKACYDQIVDAVDQIKGIIALRDIR